MTEGVPTGTPAEHAQTRLDVLKSSPEWSAKLMSGDPATFDEFNELSHKALGMVPPAPTVQDSARARLDRMSNDPAFAAKFFSGDVVAVQEFNRAVEAADAESGGQAMDLLANTAMPPPPFGEITIGQDAQPDRVIREAIEGLREFVRDEVILEGLTGFRDTPATIAKVRAYKTQRMADPEWCKRLMSGGWAERRELTLISTILAFA